MVLSNLLKAIHLASGKPKLMLDVFNYDVAILYHKNPLDS